jgi:hypothetical protein
MFETPLSENRVIGICSLLRLTHLSFNTWVFFAGETEIRYILANSKSLNALILIFADDLALEDADEYQDYEYFCDDPGRWSRLALPGTIGREVQREETITGSGQKDSYRGGDRAKSKVCLWTTVEDT